MSKVDDVLTYAQAQIGDPYVFGDEGPDTFDCSGLIQYVLGLVGIGAPRTSQEQQAWANPVASPRPGDLVFYGRPATHVGLYIGDGKMIDAPHAGAKVRVDQVGSPTSYGRVPGLGAAIAPIAGAAAQGWGTVTGWLGGARHLVLELAFVGLGVVVAGAGLYLITTASRRT